MERAKGYGGFGQADTGFYTIFGPYKCNRNLILNIMKKVVFCIIYPCDYRIFCINGKLFE